MADPSKDWTPDERKAVIHHIVAEMHQVGRNGQLIYAERVLDWSDRINIVLTMPATFLENNREHIINGSPGLKKA